VGWEASWEKRKAGMEKRAIKWSFMEAPVRWEYGTAGERGMEQGRGKSETAKRKNDATLKGGATK
jgi:hypothetical protein